MKPGNLQQCKVLNPAVVSKDEGVTSSFKTLRDAERLFTSPNLMRRKER